MLEIIILFALLDIILGLAAFTSEVKILHTATFLLAAVNGLLFLGYYLHQEYTKFKYYK